MKLWLVLGDVILGTTPSNLESSPIFIFLLRMAKNIKLDPTKYGVEEDKLWQTEKLLLSLKGQLLDGVIFQVL